MVNVSLVNILALNVWITTPPLVWLVNLHSRLTLITNVSLASILVGLAQITIQTTVKLAKDLIPCMLKMVPAFSVMILIVKSVLASIDWFAMSASMASL